MPITFHLSPDAITLTASAETSGLFSRMFGSRHIPITERDDLLLALADLREIADRLPGSVEIDGDRIKLKHDAAAMLPGASAEALGLPPTVDLTFCTDVDGIVGSPDFRLRYEWQRGGRRELTMRTGAILETSQGPRRLPIWIKRAVDLADGFDGAATDADAWGALAEFRHVLEPEGPEAEGPRQDMANFLAGLRVRVADSFAISPQDGDTFDVLPFSHRALDGLDPDEAPGEEMSELTGTELRAFQSRVAHRGALPAYRIGDGSFLVVDRSVAPVLEVMAGMQRASRAERAAFIRNPRQKITEAVERHLRDTGKLAGLNDAEQEEAVEAVAGPALVETREYSERVTGVVAWAPPAIDMIEGSGTTWLPEAFSDVVAAAIRGMQREEVETLRDELKDALTQGAAQIEIAGEPVAVTPQTVAAIEAELVHRDSRDADAAVDPEPEDERAGPIVLETADNFEQLAWRPERGPRQALVADDLPRAIKTVLKPHQSDSFRWQQEAWEAGLPGVLNADEQGLGKTLQTIAFLAWLKSHTACPGAEVRGPVLVVAPTSLLKTWEEEVATHVEEPGLGHLVRLYGSATSSMKATGRRGQDIRIGEATLDFGWLDEALAEDRAHRFWILTTYTTLTNYQHSLGRIPFAAAVFDEIQAVKNPASLRASAARAMQADFRIALTGTPIENSTADLWAIMDQVTPGALGTLRDFRATYGTPTDTNMTELHARVFHQQGALPPLGLRRMKEAVARDLPRKERRIHPSVMPARQAAAYEDARVKMAGGGRGAALKMLHHIRSVSVHPALDDPTDGPAFIDNSARLERTFAILDGIHARGERALVFIENLKMQYRFAEITRRRFAMERVDIINGSTPIPRRQEIVNRFQQHLITDRGFDLLVLGPRAAGTGLTLTAATHVIHLSRWWNPAVEEQCNDRIHRLGQTRPVTIHMPMAIHPDYREQSFDCLLQSLMQRKRNLAAAALWPMADTGSDATELQNMINNVASTSGGNPVEAALAGMFARDGLPLPALEADGSRVVG